MHEITLVDLAHPYPTGNRSRDVRAIELRAGVLDGGLIPLRGGQGLVHEEALGAVALLVEGVLADEVLVAPEHEARVRQLGFVLRFLGDGLAQLGLEGARVDLRQ